MDKPLDDKNQPINFAEACEIQITDFPERWNVFVTDKEGDTQHLQKTFRDKYQAFRYVNDILFNLHQN
jgi:hypothetical protein